METITVNQIGEQWNPATEPPKTSDEVLGYSPNWIDEDYNQDGICMCFYQNDEWTVARWCGQHDEWHTRHSSGDDLERFEETIKPPMYWMPKPAVLKIETISQAEPTFLKTIESAINSFNQESRSNTPDFILAQYMASCLNAFNEATRHRDEWYKISPKPNT